MLGVGVIGCGYWGPNLVRNFHESPDARVVRVCDLSPERLGRIEARYPGVGCTTDYEVLLADPNVDAVAIATPVSSHFELAMAALRAGKHVLVEKPLASSAAQAAALVEAAERAGLTLMVDHTFVYTGAVRKIKKLVDSGELGTVHYYDSVRVNLGLFQHDVNVVWDLAVHDLAILDYVITDRPRAVSALGMSHVSGQPENIAYLTLLYDSGFIAHVHANWLAPVKLRRTLVGGSKKMIVYDDLEPSEKIKIYDSGVTLEKKANVYQMLVGYRTGDVWIPQIERNEALRVEVAHFVECIARRERPLTDGAAGLRIVEILEAAARSIASDGQTVSLRDGRRSPDAVEPGRSPGGHA